MTQKSIGRTPRVVVVVTQEHVDTALPKNSGHCMISDAVKAAVPNATGISTDLQTVRFTLNGQRNVYLTPRVGQLALVRFDQGISVPPFQFVLRSGQAFRAGQKKEGASRKTNLVTGGRGTSNGSVPTIQGGVAPPRAALTDGPRVRGARRSFGLRALEL